MKFIFITKQLGTGGGEHSTRMLCRGLVDRGYSVEVWHIGDNQKHHYPKWEGCGALMSVTTGTLKAYKPSSDEQLVLPMNHGWKYAHKSAIVILHGDIKERFINKTNWFSKWKARRRLLSKLSKHTYLHMSRMLAKENGQIINKTIGYLPNAFDADNVTRLSKKRVVPISDRKYIIHIGRISNEKNQPRLLNTYINNERLNSVVDLVFIGGSANQETRSIEHQMRKTVNSSPLKNNVHLMGNINNPFPYLKDAACLVLCSRQESMGYVILEALTLGVPVVSTMASGPVELLGKDYAGLAASDSDIVNKIMLALASPEIFAKPVSKEYQIGNVVDAFIREIQNDQ